MLQPHSLTKHPPPTLTVPSPAFDRSLQYLSSVEPSAHLFTASIHGVLELRRGQYVSVHIDNATRARLVAVRGSQFSGAMLGR